MAKIAFLFPGQGAQKIGMGKDLFDKYSVARAVFEEADKTLGFSITDMCFNGPEEDLKLTMNTQPALLTVSAAALAVLEELGIKPDCAAGHSLGEYGALVAGKVLSFADAVKTVRARGEFMQEAVPAGEGAMAAIIGLERDRIIEICTKITGETGLVQAVNFNMPGQIVIAGITSAVNQACEELKAAGARRALLLPVSAPFHSLLMKPAAEKLEKVLDTVDFSDSLIPIISNVDARASKTAATLKAKLVHQVASPVLWEDSVAQIVNTGVDFVIEVGAGPLAGFMKKIAPDITAIGIDDEASIAKMLELLKEKKCD
ncbi:MAG: ACP S-malonyltransferase [Negativicutes bacterium]|jgi:[acyl-carrier-protein] S-malonyltransferase